MPQENDSHSYEKPETLVEWRGPLRVFHQREAGWFAGLFLLALILVIALALLKQFTLMLVVVAFTFAMYALNRVEPQETTYQIRTTGVKVGEKEYPYRNLKWFWLQKEGERLVLRISTYLSFPHLLILVAPLDKQEQIEQALLKYLPYHEEKERDFLQWVERAVDFLSPRLPQPLLRLYSKVSTKI